MPSVAHSNNLSLLIFLSDRTLVSTPEGIHAFSMWQALQGSHHSHSREESGNSDSPQPTFIIPFLPLSLIGSDVALETHFWPIGCQAVSLKASRKCFLSDEETGPLLLLHMVCMGLLEMRQSPCNHRTRLGAQVDPQRRAEDDVGKNLGLSFIGKLLNSASLELP